MLIYVNFEVNDLGRSAQFYDAFLGEVDAKRVLDRKNEFIAWGTDIQTTYFAITPKKEGRTRQNNDSHLIAIDRQSVDEVDSLFAKGIELGATIDSPLALDEREIYAGILKDLDGHRIRVFCITA